MVPPSGGVSWAQVHHDCSLHLGNARIPPGSPTVEGSEDGGDRRAASGRESGHPRLHQLLMHLWEKSHRVERGCEPRSAARNQSSSHEGSGLGSLLTSSPILTAARASMAISSGSGAAVATTPEGGSPSAPSSSEDVSPSPDAAIGYPRMAHRMKCWAPRGTDQQNYLGTGWDVRCVRSKRSVGTRRRGSYCHPQISLSTSR